MKMSFALWLVVVTYAIAAAWAADTYWKHHMAIKVALFAPIFAVCLSLLFEEQVMEIRQALARRLGLRKSPEQEDLVIVHLRAESLPSETDEDWDLFTLQDELEQILQNKQLGSCDGNEIGEDEALLFFSGSNGEALWESIAPVLRACPLCRGGSARIIPCAPGSAEREVLI